MAILEEFTARTATTASNDLLELATPGDEYNVLLVWCKVDTAGTGTAAVVLEEKWSNEWCHVGTPVETFALSSTGMHRGHIGYDKPFGSTLRLRVTVTSAAGEGNYGAWVLFKQK